jgi:hypothetical protein
MPFKEKLHWNLENSAGTLSDNAENPARLGKSASGILFSFLRR